MTPTLTPLTLDELKARGLILEANRRVFHPAGVEFRAGSSPNGAPADLFIGQAVEVDEPRFAWTPDLVNEAREKAAQYESEVAARDERRRAMLGERIQSIPGFNKLSPVTLSSDDATVENIVQLAQGIFDGIDLDPATRDDLTDAVLLKFVGRLISGLQADLNFNLMAPAAQATNSPSWRAGRARFLARELARVRELGNPELFASELEEAGQLIAVVESWPLDMELSDGDARKTLDRMEDLFSLAQPGMRFWRGEGHDISVKTIRTKIAAHRAAMSEFDKFLAGEMPASELTDAEGVRRELLARVAPLEESLADLESERSALLTAVSPLKRALAALDVLLPVVP